MSIYFRFVLQCLQSIFLWEYARQHIAHARASVNILTRLALIFLERVRAYSSNDLHYSCCWTWYTAGRRDKLAGRLVRVRSTSFYHFVPTVHMHYPSLFNVHIHSKSHQVTIPTWWVYLRPCCLLPRTNMEIPSLIAGGKLWKGLTHLRTGVRILSRMLLLLHVLLLWRMCWYIVLCWFLYL